MNRHYRQLSRYAAAFALVSDVAILTLGGRLKRKEMLSARLGDVLSELYFLSAVLKRFQDEGRQDADRPLVDYCMDTGLRRIESSLGEVLANLPNRVAAWTAKLVVQPFGSRRLGPSDNIRRRCAAILLEPSGARDRVTADIFPGCRGDSVARLEEAFRLTVETAPLRRKLRQAKRESIADGLRHGMLTEHDAERLRAAERAVSDVIAVDDYDPSKLSPLARTGDTRGRRQPVENQTAAE
jgi:acyl-CoA dehydrogenase